MNIVTFKPIRTGNQDIDDMFFQLKNDIEALAHEKATAKARTTTSVSGAVSSRPWVGPVPVEGENRIRRGVIEATGEGSVTFTFAEIPVNVECYVQAVVSYTDGNYGIGIPDYTTLTRTAINVLVDGAGTVRCGLIYY